MKATKDLRTMGNLMKRVIEVNNVHLMVFQWEYNKAGTPVRWRDGAITLQRCPAQESLVTLNTSALNPASYKRIGLGRLTNNVKVTSWSQTHANRNQLMRVIWIAVTVGLSCFSLFTKQHQPHSSYQLRLISYERRCCNLSCPIVFKRAR